MSDRPMVNVPEGPSGENVYREMNDDEHAVWKADVKAEKERRKVEAEAPHPLVAQVEAMSADDKKALLAALGA